MTSIRIQWNVPNMSWFVSTFLSQLPSVNHINSWYYIVQVREKHFNKVVSLMSYNYWWLLTLCAHHHKEFEVAIVTTKVATQLGLPLTWVSASAYTLTTSSVPDGLSKQKQNYLWTLQVVLCTYMVMRGPIIFFTAHFL